LIGPTGYAAQNYVVDGNVFAYEILFANETNATAPAQIVQITDQLSTNLDWTTFRLTEIAFGTQIISIPPDSQQFQTNVPLSYNGTNFVVQISAGIQLATGQVFANFYSINPVTLLPPPAGIGFLPPDSTNHLGEGHVSYIVSPRPNLPTGLQISNVAYIQFDQNPAVATDLIDDNNPSLGVDTNKMAIVTIDSTPPVSSVLSLPATETNISFTVCWSGTDVGGPGILGYNIYVSTNNGPWTPWLVGTANTCATFTGQNGDNYGFYSVAYDGAGNVQTNSGAAQASTTVVVSSLAVTALQPGPNGVSVFFNRTINSGVLSLYGTNGSVCFTLVGSNSGPVTGSLIVGDQATNVTFVKTAGPLPADTYSVTLVSATNAFQDLYGNLLAGNAGVPGDNYVAQFTVAPLTNRVLFLPNFARAPGQPVNVPATNSGIPLAINEGSNVLSVSLSVQYDTNLLKITGVSLGSAVPAGWALTNNAGPAGILQLSLGGPTPLSPGTNTLATLQALVPWCSPYATVGILNIDSVQINGGTIPAVGDSAVEVTALLGDADGNGTYTIYDAELISQVSVGQITGFEAYPLVDPVIIGAVTGDSQISISDVVAVAQIAVGLPVPLIPTLPAPSLSIIIVTNQALISWPQCANGYVLEQSSTLGTQATWTTVTNMAITVADQQSIAIIPTETTQFYRLVKQ